MSITSSVHNPETAIIILNFRGVNDTIACIESLSNQSYKDFVTIVIDNRSGDNSYSELDEYNKNTQCNFVLLKNDKNLGFAGGVNVGIQYASTLKCKYVALLNNDALPDCDWLHHLVKTLTTSEDVGITTGLLLHQNGDTIDSTGEQFSTWGLAFPRDRNKLKSQASDDGYTFGATGGASLYKMALFNDIGLFDDRFFLYYEDLDVSFRAQLAGWKVYYNPLAIAYHKQGASTSKIPGLQVYSHFKNTPLLFAKDIPISLVLPIGVRFTFAYIMMFGNALINGNCKPAVKGWMMSVYLFWFHAIPARRKIQRKRKVSDEYIRSILWPDLPPDQTGLRKFRQIFTGKK